MSTQQASLTGMYVWTTSANTLRTYETTLRPSLSPIAINDRLFMSDESLTGDPMGYITASQLSDFILDLDANFATEETSVADVDKFLLP